MKAIIHLHFLYVPSYLKKLTLNLINGTFKILSRVRRFGSTMTFYK